MYYVLDVCAHLIRSLNHNILYISVSSANQKSRSTIRALEKNGDGAIRRNKAIGSVSSKKVVVTETTVTKARDEMEILSLTKMIDGKLKHHASLVEDKKTSSMIALQVTNGSYDENNVFWQDVRHNCTMLREIDEEIKSLQCTLNYRISKKRTADAMNDSIDNSSKPPSRLFETPRSSVSLTTICVDNGNSDKEVDEATIEAQIS